jgi:hypothetical protein
MKGIETMFFFALKAILKQLKMLKAVMLPSNCQNPTKKKKL